jgi:hypothetical protein
MMNQTKLLQMLDGHLSTMLKHLHQLLEADRRVADSSWRSVATGYRISHLLMCLSLL